MRKIFKSAMSMALAAAMVVTSGIGVAPAKAAVTSLDNATKKTGATYNAYMAFQFAGYWVSRSEWNNSESGRNDVRETGDKITVNEKEYTYDYATQYLAYNVADTAVNNGAFKDAVMTSNGTYTLEANVPVTSFTNAGSEAWSMFHISTDIPLTVSGVTCKNIKIYLDGSTTPYATLAQAKYNIQKTTNGGCYDFFVFDQYSGNHGTTGVLDYTKYTKFPSKSIKVQFDLGGLDFSAPKQSVAVATGAVAGTKFTVDGVTYKVLTRAMDDGTAGTVTVAGLNATGKKKTSITLPASVKSGTCSYKVSAIAGSAFKGATKLKSITLNSAITSVPSKAFYGCTKLTTVKLGSAVKTIGASAFQGCKSLKKITLGNKVTSIKKSAFAKCTKLTTVKFGTAVKTIGASAFQGCTSLKKVTLGKKVKSIGKTAFTKCTKLSKITVYQKVKVSKNAFKGCKKTITVSSSKKAYKTYTVKQITKSGYKKVK